MFNLVLDNSMEIKVSTTFLTMFMIIVSAFSLVSCSDDDGSIGGSSDFLEVEIDGVTYSINAETYVYVPVDYGLVLQTCTDEINTRTGSITYELVHYDNMEMLSYAPAGIFDIKEKDYYQNFDLIVNIEAGHNVYQVETGVNAVTSVKRSGDCVVVEGEFAGCVGDIDMAISGRYRMTLDDLDIYTDEKFEYTANGLNFDDCDNVIIGHSNSNLRNVCNTAEDECTTAFFSDGDVFYPFKMMHRRKSEILELIQKEGDNAKNLFYCEIESPIINYGSDPNYSDDMGWNADFRGYEYNIVSLKEDRGSVVVEGNIKVKLYGLVYVGGDSFETSYSYMEFSRDYLKYKMIIP